MSENIIKRCQQQRYSLFSDYKIFNLHWHKTPPLQTSPIQRQWLNWNQSLTYRLSQIGHIEIKRVEEHIGICSPDEAAAMQYRANMVWYREIIILLNAIPVIAARSVTSLSASQNIWASLRQLGNRPLAILLYQNKKIQRSPFAFQLYCPHSTSRYSNFKKIIPLDYLDNTQKNILINNQEDKNGANLNETDLIISRRSIFLKNQKPLLVTESFLPSLWNHFVL